MSQTRASDCVLDQYELQYSSKINEVIPVFKYVSKRSGLRVVVAQVEGPLVNGYFCVATEAHDDDGLPHTLEHLVFLGSEDYPYKGVLDLVANRCLSSGTNAWTDTDHTCYTMTTAGSDGFLNLMPLYLDHVLYPTLSESGYVTEVHHVNGEGDDAGVVYCEMQARENTGESLTHLEMLRALFPGRCGYKSETGGILRNLRTSTSHEKVKKYHRDFYRPENLYLVVTGMIDPSQVLERIQSFEDKIHAKGCRSRYERPWQTPVPPLLETVEKTVPFPCDEEELGMVVVAWRGPLAKEQRMLSSIMILMEYLTHTAVSPLQRDFVELDEPYANEVNYAIIENSESCLYINFENVFMTRLKEVTPRLLDLLEKMSKGTEVIDMERMKSIIHRQILEAMSSLEDSPHNFVAFHVIGEFLYGNTTEDMELRLNPIETFRELEKEPVQFWIDLVTKTFIGKNYVSIIGEPSKKLMSEMGETEKERIAEQKRALGDEGLAKKDALLKQAIEENEKPAPDAMLTCVDVPNVESIQFHRLTPASNHDERSAVSNKLFPLDTVPFAFQLDDITTNFVMMSVLMNTNSIPIELKPYLPLYLEVILESPLLRDNKVVPYEIVVKELAAETLNSVTCLGIWGSRFSCGQFSDVAVLSLKVEMCNYEKGVKWLRDLLYNVEFSEERLKIVASKMVNDVSKMKRDGRTVAQTLMREINFKKDSNHHVTSMIRQHKFLSGVIQTLEKDKDGIAQLVEKMKKVREILTRPSQFRVHMAAHVERLSIHCNGSPADVWKKTFLPSSILTDGERLVIKKDSEFVNPDGDCSSRAMIVGVGSVESCYLVQVSPCISDFNDPDIPALRVYMNYLTQLEGPMWRQIRGLGLSYNYGLYMKPETGLIYFSLFKSAQLVEAFKQAKKIVDGLLDGTIKFSDVELESSKSSLIFEIIEEEKTPANASCESLLSYFRGTSHGYNRSIIQKIPSVTIEDLERVGKKHLGPLFDSTKSRAVVCCHPTKVQEISEAFKTSLDRNFKVVESLDEAFLAEF